MPELLRSDSTSLGLVSFLALRSRRPDEAASVAHLGHHQTRGRQSVRSPKSVLIQANAIVPPPITAHVATVRHRMSVPVNSQIASRQATTATRIHRLVVQKANPLTLSGFRKPRLFLCGWEYCPSSATVRSFSSVAAGFTALYFRVSGHPAVECGSHAPACGGAKPCFAHHLPTARLWAKKAQAWRYSPENSGV